MALIKLSVPNWNKFNPRSDRANYTWFRFQSDYFSNQSVFPLTDSQIALHAFCLCEMSKKNAPHVELLSDYIAAMRRRKEADILKDLKELAAHGLISVEIGGDEPAYSQPMVGDQPTLLPATYERTNETRRDETNGRTIVSAAVEKSTTPAAAIVLELEAAYEPEARRNLETVSIAAQRSWLSTYPDPGWISQEVSKATGWIILNPKKKPKSFGKFFGYWLSRGWEKHRKTIASNPAATGSDDWKREYREAEARDAHL